MIDRIKANDSTQPLLHLCQQFALEANLDAGNQALALAGSDAVSSVQGETAGQCLQLLIDATKADAEVRDALVATLLQHSPAARQYLASKLQDSVSLVFEYVFKIGDGAANGITVVSLDPSAWPNELLRRRFETDMFLLFLAKLLESGHDNDGRALKGISRHLAVDADGLHSKVDEESFEAILACLDYRLTQEVRGQATLATAKYLEASKETGEQYLTRSITTRTAKHSTEDLVIAFSVAAAVFPIATPLISGLFLVEGFLPSLVPLLDKKSRPITVEKAALDLLSAACIDAGCREAISKYCWDWMHHVMEDETDERHGQAALILAKVQTQSTSSSEPTTSHVRRPSKDIADVVPTLKDMVIAGTEIDRRTGIEGLAYASVQPFVKDDIVRDTSLVEKLFKLPKKDSISPTMAFGYLTMIDNLTRYLLTLSEEQKKMSELKAYANASKSDSQPDPLDEEEHVSDRCTRLLDANLLPFLVTLRSSAIAAPLSMNSLGLMAKIILSLSKNAANRGSLTQKGSIPLLLQIHATVGLHEAAKSVAAHGLARILISVDPALIINYTSACVAPLLALVHQATSSATSDKPRDLLPSFEALLALTNLVSDVSRPTGVAVIRAAFADIEDLLLSQNALLQRAATELICNLMTIPEGLEMFANGSVPAARRLHVLLALADSEDVPTRRAAGGALAGISEFPDAVSAIIKREGGIKRLVELCQDEDEGCVHRGVVCVQNVATCEGTVGVAAKRALQQQGALEILKEVLKKSRNQAVLDATVATLKALLATS